MTGPKSSNRFHINNGNDKAYCKSRSKTLTSDPDESSCESCHESMDRNIEDGNYAELMAKGPLLPSNNPLWENNEIQFARLLEELVAALPERTLRHAIKSCAESMDLEIDEVQELFVRSQKVWDQAKENI